MQDRSPLSRRTLLQRMAGPYIRVIRDVWGAPAQCQLCTQKRSNLWPAGAVEKCQQATSRHIDHRRRRSTQRVRAFHRYDQRVSKHLNGQQNKRGAVGQPIVALQ